MNLCRKLYLGVFLSLFVSGAAFSAPDSAAGQEKAAMCFGCHGVGATGMGVTPRLAGQHPAYLKRQLKAFKDGSRKNGPMRGIANMLSDDDMAAVVEHMGSLK